MTIPGLESEDSVSETVDQVLVVPDRAVDLMDWLVADWTLPVDRILGVDRMLPGALFASF